MLTDDANKLAGKSALADLRNSIEDLMKKVHKLEDDSQGLMRSYDQNESSVEQALNAIRWRRKGQLADAKTQLAANDKSLASLKNALADIETTKSKLEQRIPGNQGTVRPRLQGHAGADANKNASVHK